MKSKINYNVLKKTAENRGVMCETYNGVHYIGNSYIAVFGMSDEEFLEAVAKTDAKEFAGYGKVVESKNTVSQDLQDTGIVFKERYHFFKVPENGAIVIDEKLYNAVKKAQYIAFGNENKSAIVFKTPSAYVMVMSMMFRGGNKEATELRKMFESY